MLPWLLLFDIDGTILKVCNDLPKDIFNQVFQNFFNISYSIPIDFDFSGLTDLAILRKISQLYSIPFELVLSNIEKIWDSIFFELQKNIQSKNIALLPGVLEAIRYFSQCDSYFLGLLTGNFRRSAYYKLKLVGLELFFPFGAFGDDDENRSNLLPKAIERANLFVGSEIFDFRNSVIFGDSIPDIVSAKKNQVRIIAVATGKTSKDLLLAYQPDFLINSFLHLDKIIEYLQNEKNHYRY